MGHMNDDRPISPLAAAAGRVGDRWALLVVDALLAGSRKFGELQESLAPIAPNILSNRLKHLVKEGVVLARPYSERPPRFEYALTGSGMELAGALRLLAHWGTGQAPDGDQARHDVCGTPVVPIWWCPTCARGVDDEASDLRFV